MQRQDTDHRSIARFAKTVRPCRTITTSSCDQALHPLPATDEGRDVAGAMKILTVFYVSACATAP